MLPTTDSYSTVCPRSGIEWVRAHRDGSGSGIGARAGASVS